jgi:hypothetical protein
VVFLVIVEDGAATGGRPSTRTDAGARRISDKPGNYGGIMAYAGFVVSLIAVVVSTVAFVLNRRTAEEAARDAKVAARDAKDAARHGRMPVLIATRGRGEIGIRNIGSAPALNIVIAKGLGEIASVEILDASLADYQTYEIWTEHRHLDPIPAGTEHWYRWSADGQVVVGLTFTDALGYHYTAVSSKFGTKVVDDFTLIHRPLTELHYPERIKHPSDT